MNCERMNVHQFRGEKLTQVFRKEWFQNYYEVSRRK